MPSTTAVSFDVEFARLAGDVAEDFSFNRSLGQIYGLLFVQETPMALEDIGKRLSMSKGNVSLNVRQLESWGAVRPVSVVGSRKDYYEAHRDIKEIGLRRLREGLTKRLDHTDRRLAALSTESLPLPQRKRLQDVQTLLTRSRRALKLLGSVLG